MNSIYTYKMEKENQQEKAISTEEEKSAPKTEKYKAKTLLEISRLQEVRIVIITACGFRKAFRQSFNRLSNDRPNVLSCNKIKTTRDHLQRQIRRKGKRTRGRQKMIKWKRKSGKCSFVKRMQTINISESYKIGRFVHLMILIVEADIFYAYHFITIKAAT